MKQPLISVLLPVYNVERFLIQCLDSISEQTYQNIEVLLIIDGATDNSYELAKEYSLKDSRFTVYWQENAGSGPARNNGLSHAKGEYIIFIDPDDWIEPNYVETLYKEASEKGFELVVSSKTDKHFDENDNLKGEKIIEVIPVQYQDIHLTRIHYLDLLQTHLLSAPTTKLYKMSVIKQNGIVFPDLRRSQDVVFNYRYFNCIKSISLINYKGYNYRMIDTKYTTKLPSDYYKTIVLIYHDIEKLHKQWEIGINYKKISTILFIGLAAAIEAQILRNESISPILNEPTINRIIQQANPHDGYRKVFAFLLRRKLYFCLNPFLQIKRNVKSLMIKLGL